MCLYPKIIKNPKYTANKKNGGVIPHLKDIRLIAVPIGCGRCIECFKKKEHEWRARLSEEIVNQSGNIKYVALTFSIEEYQKLDKEIDKKIKGYERENAISSLAVRRFTERWRKDKKKSIRHWLVTELGGKNYEKIHLHGFLFTKEENNYIREKWKYGNIWFHDENKGYINQKTVNYVIKYICKIDEKHKHYKSKIYASNGIGKGFLEKTSVGRNKYKKGKTKETYKTATGHEIALPLYYRNKIYTEEEREKLWIEKLDKGERWLMGVRMKDYEQWSKNIKFAREENERKGFGGKIDWEEKRYEEERRTLLQEKIRGRKDI